jgi:hypothetical protein
MIIETKGRCMPATRALHAGDKGAGYRRALNVGARFGDSDFSAAEDDHQQGLQDAILFLRRGCSDSIQTLVWETIQVSTMIGKHTANFQCSQ